MKFSCSLKSIGNLGLCTVVLLPISQLSMIKSPFWSHFSPSPVTECPSLSWLRVTTGVANVTRSRPKRRARSDRRGAKMGPERAFIVLNWEGACWIALYVPLEMGASDLYTECCNSCQYSLAQENCWEPSIERHVFECFGLWGQHESATWGTGVSLNKNTPKTRLGKDQVVRTMWAEAPHQPEPRFSPGAVVSVSKLSNATAFQHIILTYVHKSL